MDRVQEEETRGSQSSSVLGWFGKKEEPEEEHPDQESGFLSKIFTSDKKKDERTKR